MNGVNSSESGAIGTLITYAVVAQLAEQLICNQQVTGSSPVNGLHIILLCFKYIWRDSRVAKGGRL